MKVRIDNWGPIEHCEYDLDKDMIVVYGDNNIGKSYAMQLIYLYLKNIINYAKNIMLLFQKCVVKKNNINNLQ